MKFSILSEHKNFFLEHGYITFKELVSSAPVGEGRDLWRADDGIKKISCSRRLAEVMAELVNLKQIQLAYDWGNCPLLTTLAEQSAFQALAGGLILAPDGSGTFISPDCPFVDLNLDPELHYFLIAYAGPYACYIFNEGDPHMHDLKDLGYVFGDRLQAKFHPILFTR